MKSLRLRRALTAGVRRLNAGVRPLSPVAFIRFAVSRRNADSGVKDGLFGVAYELLRGHELSATARSTLRSGLKWFEANLATPSRLNRSKSKGYYRRTTKGISWFRDAATEHIAQMHQLKRVLEEYGYTVELIKEDRIGYVVYEDDHQVVAEPFSDTRTGCSRPRP